MNLEINSNPVDLFKNVAKLKKNFVVADFKIHGDILVPQFLDILVPTSIIRKEKKSSSDSFIHLFIHSLMNFFSIFTVSEPEQNTLSLNKV